MDVVTTSNHSVTTVSLVGTYGEFPLGHGNYFGMIVDDKFSGGIINMWYENLREAQRRFNVRELTFTVFNKGKGIAISSPDIPDDWFIEGLFMEYNCRLNWVEQRKVREYYAAQKIK